MWRRLIFFVLLVGAAVVPYAIFNKDWYPRAKSAWDGLWAPGPGGEAGVTARAQNFVASLFASSPKPVSHQPLVPNAPVTPLTGERVANFAEIFRFDISPDWVLQRWGRVSTVLSEPGLEALRVAVVTGPEVDDLAGSLTYYFDQQRTVQRITFRGVTGDTKRLVELAEKGYLMQRDPSVVALQYSNRRGNKLLSVVRITTPAVVRAAQPYNKFDVALELNRANSRYGLSQEMQQTLTADSFYSVR